MVNFSEFKKFFLFSLIGALVISAIVAVMMVIVHSLISLAFIWDDKRQNTFERLAFFTNVLFVIIVVSFITSVLGIWKIVPSEIVWNLYQTYFVVGFASLHSDILSKALHKKKYLDMIIYLNYVFIGIVVLMLLPVIYINNAFDVLGELYYRFLGAVGIIDGTLSILTIILYKLYMRNHPNERNALAGGMETGKKQKKGLSIWVWILIVYLLLQVVLPLIFLGGYWVFSR